MNEPRYKTRLLPISLCLASVFACFAYAYLRSDLPDWWRNHGGGVPYVISGITLWFAIFPKPKFIIAICVGCVLITCLLEFLQAVEMPQLLEDFRRTRLGAAWLGYGFDVLDIPPYFLGGVIGWWLVKLVSLGTPQIWSRTG